MPGLKKFKGKFNYHGQVFTLYTHAKDLSKARRNLLDQLVKKLGLDRVHGYRMLRSYFSQKPNNHIREVLED